MRGTHCAVPARPAVMGIIPAYAGNTSLRRALVRSRRDHPRVCGEHTGGSQRMMHNPGSSPRMRGTLLRYLRGFLRDGIIPAYAGNTFFLLCEASSSRDHPRVCGEHFVVVLHGFLPLGSSPRMRGTHWVRPHPNAMMRIIPAYAGNTRYTAFMFD